MPRKEPAVHAVSSWADAAEKESPDQNRLGRGRSGEPRPRGTRATKLLHGCVADSVNTCAWAVESSRAWMIPVDAPYYTFPVGLLAAVKRAVRQHRGKAEATDDPTPMVLLIGSS